MSNIICIISILFFLNITQAAQLEKVNDDDLINLVKTEKYVIVLFTKKDCDECDKLENELTNIRDDLVDTLNAWVVKSINSQLVRAYDSTKEPALIFFRHGVPLLYDGPVNEEFILQHFTENKEPTVKELSDDTFEHLTQASTGATTGDWLVLFYTPNCVDCMRLQARWEAVGAALKNRINVARVNKASSGAATGRRFNVESVPAIILFRQGKMYRYEVPKHDVQSFVAFAQDWYKNSRSERIPVPKSPFDDLIAQIVDMLKELISIAQHILENHPWIWQVVIFGGIGFSLVAITAVIAKVKAGKSQSTKKKS